MLKEYIVDLKYDRELNKFKCFLKCHNIYHEILDDIGKILIKTTPMCASFINSIYYVEDVTENITLKAQEIKPAINSSTYSSRLSKLTNMSQDNTKTSQTPQEQWFRRTTGVEQQWRNNITGKNIKIAVIDSGVGPHKSLKLAGEVNLTQFSTTNEDTRGSGTIAAGVIACRDFEQNILGVAYDCELYSVKIVEDNGDFSLWSLYEAIEWCIDNDIDIAAITLSIRPQDIRNPLVIQNLAESILKADKKGVIVASPVGANGQNVVNIPASIDGSYSITGVYLPGDDYSSLKLKTIPNANTGTVDFSAPGKDITTTFLNNTYYSTFVSTGIACAYFAGGVALLLSEDRTRTSEDIYNLLYQNVEKTYLIPYSKGGVGLAYYGDRGTDIPG